jgi:hypothetical protein
MSTGFSDSDENAVSAGNTLPENPSTDSLADLPASEDTDDAEDHGPRNDVDDRDDDDDKRYTLDPLPGRDNAIRQQIRMGNLLLTIDNPAFAYAMQRGMEIASQDVHFLNFEGKPEMSMHELLEEMQQQFEEGQRIDEVDALGQLFGEICYLLLGTTSMQVQFSRRCRLVWK